MVFIEIKYFPLLIENSLRFPSQETIPFQFHRVMERWEGCELVQKIERILPPHNQIEVINTTESRLKGTNTNKWITTLLSAYNRITANNSLLYPNFHVLCNNGVYIILIEKRMEET